MWLARFHSQRSEVTTASSGNVVVPGGQSFSVVLRTLSLAVVILFLGAIVADDLAFGQRRGFGGGGFRGGGFGGGFGGGGFRGGGFSRQPTFRPPPPTFRPKPIYRPPVVKPPVSAPRPMPRPASPPTPIRGSDQKAVTSTGSVQGTASRPPIRSGASMRAQQVRNGVGTRLIQVKGGTYRVPQQALSRIQKSTCGIGKSDLSNDGRPILVSHAVRVANNESCSTTPEQIYRLRQLFNNAAQGVNEQNDQKQGESDQLGGNGRALKAPDEVRDRIGTRSEIKDRPDGISSPFNKAAQGVKKQRNQTQGKTDKSGGTDQALTPPIVLEGDNFPRLNNPAR